MFCGYLLTFCLTLNWFWFALFAGFVVCVLSWVFLDCVYV